MPLTLISLIYIYLPKEVYVLCISFKNDVIPGCLGGLVG